MEKKISTKERILYESLKLFSERGFDSVTVAEIAAQLNISAPALYKHYKNKQDIFDAIIEMSRSAYKEAMASMNVDFKNHPELKDKYINMTEQEHVELLTKLFLHAMHSKVPGQFRKLLTVEQFNKPELGQIFNRHYIESHVKQFECYFSMMMEAGKIKKCDPFIMGVQYISPVIVAITMCDHVPENEPLVLKWIEQHVHQFFETYSV